MIIGFFLKYWPGQPCYPTESAQDPWTLSYLPFIGGVDVEVTEDSLKTYFVIQLFIGGAVIR